MAAPLQTGDRYLTRRRPGSKSYPWYDAYWLEQYDEARELLAAERPEALGAFVEAFRVLHTRRDFRPVLLDQPLDSGELGELRALISRLTPLELELHEAPAFGRFVVHDHPALAPLQGRIARIVGATVGEAVEPTYNFISLYTTRGVCPLHLDSPKAKWTFDLCLEQSVDWPIRFSRVQEWSEIAALGEPAADWESRIKGSAELGFQAFTQKPGQAIVFSGSSQWHYRDPLPAIDARQRCSMAFFHFIPAGTADLVHPERWARHFGIPELERISRDDR